MCMRERRIYIKDRDNCKECRAEARMKTENREKEEMRRFNGSLESRTVRRRERE